MKVGIIDSDLIYKGTNFPNLVCMKISNYYKQAGNEVELLTDYYNINKYDKVFIAKVFSKTVIPLGVLDNPNVEYGGTGFFYDKAPNLPYSIEHTMPDYTLYNKYVETQINNGSKKQKFDDYINYSIGYTTRGCFRKCEFCVNKKYDKVHRHSPVSEFLDNTKKNITLLDDNILAYPKWRDVFEELQSTKKPFQFKQGMDIRLMTEEKAKVISQSKYKGDIIFAFDNYNDKDIIVPKLKLFKQHCNKIPKLYLFCGFKSQDYNDIAEIFERLFLLWSLDSKGYLMRYNSVYGSKWECLYNTLAGWINQPQFQMKKSFREFVMTHQARVYTKKSKLLLTLEQFEHEYPELAKKYFDKKREMFV